MLIAETCLLLAVRNRLREGMPLNEHQCDIEMDDQVPTLARELYVTVVGAGTMPGPWHKPSGGVWDLVFSVKVTVYQGASEVPKDRRRNLFIDRLDGLNQKLDQIIRLIDYDYRNLLDAAHVLIADTPANGGNYPEPFRTFTPDPTPRASLHDVYNASGGNGGDQVAALSRGVTFSGCRFMKAR